MRSLSIMVLFLLWAAAVLAQHPVLEERPADLASLAEYIRGQDGLKERFDKALESAGDNKGEITKALELCRTRREKLTLLWLLAGMESKFFARWNEEKEEWESIRDLPTLKGELLHRNALYGLAARDRFPWCRSLPWKTFLLYVLPHRMAQEPGQDWRPVLWKELGPLVEGIDDPEDALVAVNRWAATRVKVVKAETAQDRGVLEMLESGEGREEDLATLAAACAATVGIPCASTYTPWWPRTEGNQVWNEAWVNGRWRSFLGCRPPEGNLFGAMREGKHFAKVYRRLYLESEEEPFGVDVTPSYTKTADITLDKIPVEGTLGLAVWNTRRWRIVSRSEKKEEGRFIFRNVGVKEDALFTVWGGGPPSTIVIPPLLVRSNGTVEYFSIDPIEPGGVEGQEEVKLKGMLPNAEYGIAYFSGQQFTLVSRTRAAITGETNFGRVGRTRTLYILARIYGEDALTYGRPFALEFSDGKANLLKY